MRTKPLCMDRVHHNTEISLPKSPMGTTLIGLHNPSHS